MKYLEMFFDEVDVFTKINIKLKSFRENMFNVEKIIFTIIFHQVYCKQNFDNRSIVNYI